jgi:very-short-patch-repair endonuclease
MPRAEVLLWSRLKGKQLDGHKFRRQFGVGEHIVDFYCPQLRLAIEVDGDSHYTSSAQERDTERQSVIESYGISFLRFTNREVCENIDGVLENIRKTAEEVEGLYSPYEEEGS